MGKPFYILFESLLNISLENILEIVHTNLFINSCRNWGSDKLCFLPKKTTNYMKNQNYN